MNNTFKLGRSITQLVPFIKVPANEQKPIISNKIIITMAVIGIVKIIVLLILW